MKKLFFFYSVCVFSITLIWNITICEVHGQSAETIYNVENLSFKTYAPAMAPVNEGTKAFDTTGALYSNGPLVTHPDSGSGGADVSRVQTSIGLTLIGAGFQYAANNRIADDFTNDAPWKIDSIVFFAYQTNSSTTPTITMANIRIWNGSPASGGTIIFGDSAFNYLSDTAWSEIYRDTETSKGNTTRPVMRVTCDLTDSNLVLSPGTYWLDMQANGSLASGPWMPPISIWNETNTGNAIQFASGSWGDLLSNVYPQGVPFIIYGKIIPLPDLTLKSWLYPLDDIELSNATPITVLIENIGTDTIESFEITYSTDSGITYIAPEIVNQTILPGKTLVYTFTTNADLSAYQKYLCKANIILLGDADPLNDSIQKSFYNFKRISSFPYEEDFEAAHDWHHDMISGSDSWELGEPEGTIIDTVPPGGGLNVWMTDLDANYPNNEESYVISPAFDLRSLDDAYVSMSINYRSNDITSLQYSLDKGKSWKTLGATNSQGYNWYNADNENEDYWTGNLGDWYTAIHNLKGLTGKNNVLFRVWFKSDAAVNNEGFAFDNFRVFEPTNDLAVTEWNYPTKGCGLSASDSIIVTVLNVGTLSQDTFTLYYTIDMGSTVQYELVTQNIPAGGELVYTFTTKADFSGGGNNLCYAGVLFDGDEIEYNDYVSFWLTKASDTNYVHKTFETGDIQNGWALEFQYNYKWTLNAFETPTPNTGPSRSYEGVLYEYTPAYTGFPQNVTGLYSQCLDLSGGDFGSLSFWSHMYGAEMGEMHVDLLRPSGWENDLLILEGEQQTSSADPWQQNNILLSNDITQVRIRAINGDGILSDMAIDDIIIETIHTNDVGVVSIDPPMYEIIPLHPISPNATIKNFGGMEQTFDVSISAGVTYNDTITMTLAALESQQVTFTEYTPVEGAGQTMEVRTHLLSDSFTSNDSLIMTFEADTLTKVYGYIAYTGASSFRGPCFFYLQRPDKLFPIGPSQSSMQFVAAGSWAEGNWVGAEYFGNWIYFDTLTGERDVIMNLGVDYMGLAYDWTSNRMFGMDQDGGLHAVDLITGEATYIGSAAVPGGLFINLACDSAGELYAIDIVTDTLYQINRSTAEPTGIMHIGFNANYAQDMEYDHYNDVMYLAAYNYTAGRGELRYVDFNANTTVLVGPFENDAELTAFAIPYRIPGQTKIVGFSVPGEMQGAIIDQVNHTVELSVYNYIDRTSLVADFILSEGATATVGGVDQVSGVTENDFSSPVTYLVSNDGNSQNWTVTVNQAEANILTYSFQEEVEPAVINDSTRTVEIIVGYEANMDSLIASFTLTPGAIAKVSGVVQESGVTANAFSGSLQYYIVNGDDSLDWYVYVNEGGLHGTDFLAYSFPQQESPAIINKEEHTIEVVCDEGTNISSLTASFSLSKGAIAMIGPDPQESGTTPNNFTDPLVYTIFSGEWDVQDWTVTVTVAPYTGNAIVEFKVPDQVGSEVINNGASTVEIEVEDGTDISDMRPESITVSTGASINPSASSSQDFSAGPVTYTVTSQSGDSRLWDVSVSVLVPVEEITESSGITIYPVPASAILNIQARNTTIEQVRITDMVGRITVLNNQKVVNSILTINTRQLNAGIYFIEIFTPEEVVKRRIEIIR